MSSSKPTDIRLVSKGISYQLQRVSEWDLHQLAIFSHNPGPLYVNGPALFGEFKHSGVCSTSTGHYLVFERHKQPEVERVAFKGFTAILVEIEDCYYIKDKKG